MYVCLVPRCIRGMYYDPPTPREWRHFRSKIRFAGPDECWEWQHKAKRNGKPTYGNYAGAGVHRLAYEWLGGKPCPPNLLILHSCDNPPCCNPAHLRPGNYIENMADAMARGRLSGGRPRTLSEIEGRSIRYYFSQGKSREWCAEAYGISVQKVRDILLERTKEAPLMDIGD